MDEINTAVKNLANTNLEYKFEVTKSKTATSLGNYITFVTITDQEIELSDWIVIVCGLDGSDWASVTACMNILNSPKSYGFPQKSSETFLSSVNLLVIPVANPDGYEYSFTTDRLWSKNRSPTSNPICAGVNLEENFNYNWCQDQNLKYIYTYHQ